MRTGEGTLPEGVFNPREAFGSHSDLDHVYNTPRAWAMQRFLSPHAEDWDALRLGGPESDRILRAACPSASSP